MDVHIYDIAAVLSLFVVAGFNVYITMRYGFLSSLLAICSTILGAVVTFTLSYSTVYPFEYILIWYAVGWIVPIVCIRDDIRLGRSFLVMDLAAAAGVAIFGPISIFIPCMECGSSLWGMCSKWISKKYGICSKWISKKCSRFGRIILISGKKDKDSI